MERFLRGRLLAAAMVLSTVPLCLAAPAYAQVSIAISFDSFHRQLAHYGSWVYSDRWGTVWQPGDVPDDFRPYDTGGHWEYTGEYGWTWISDYAWGDVAFHYGRWVYDRDDGWLWMPGYVWSPAWVVWRSNNDYVGWMPMPPDDDFLSGRGEYRRSTSWSDPDRYYSNWYGPGYGGGASMWVFVNFGHIADHDYHRYAARRDQVPGLVRQTTNITNYTVVNNYIVNKSIDVQRVSRAAGHTIQPVAARSVIKHPDLIGTVAHGEQVRAQMINIAPRGMGKPNSAPLPPQAVINQLSDHAVSRSAQHGGPAKHLFTKSALTQPEAATHFRGGGTSGVMPNGAAPRSQEGPRTNDHPNIQERMNAAPGGAMNGAQNGAGETGQRNRRDNGPDKTMNGPKPGSEQSNKAQHGATFDRGPIEGTKPRSAGPRNGSMREPLSGPAPAVPNAGTASAPINMPGPDNGNTRRMNHRNSGPPNTTGPDNGPAKGADIGPGPRHQGAQIMTAPQNGPNNGPVSAPRGHREMGPPTIVGPGPAERAHENGPPANGGGKGDQENRHGPKKEKEQKPPPG